MVGHNVSHSNRKTKTRKLPNLQNKKFFDENTGRWVRLRVSAKGIKTIAKKGLHAALKSAAR